MRLNSGSRRRAMLSLAHTLAEVQSIGFSGTCLPSPHLPSDRPTEALLDDFWTCCRSTWLPPKGVFHNYLDNNQYFDSRNSNALEASSLSNGYAEFLLFIYSNGVHYIYRCLVNLLLKEINFCSFLLHNLVELQKNSKNLKFFREQILTQRRVVYVVFVLILYYMFYCVFPYIINITCFFNFIILSLIVFVVDYPMWNRHKIGNRIILVSNFKYLFFVFKFLDLYNKSFRLVFKIYIFILLFVLLLNSKSDE
uniref:PRA1 family protein n=1 Tax=Heterorhabditis bacteriophora TaxID=37862 RepID=A0A1I7WG70_HETBA